MFEYSVMSTLLVLVLLKLNWCAQKRLKSQKHDTLNLIKKDKVNKELFENNQILKFQINNFKNQLKQQQNINIILLEKYNNIRENVADVPFKNARFFTISLDKKTILALFSEN